MTEFTETGLKATLAEWNHTKRKIEELQEHEYMLREMLARQVLGNKTEGSKTSKIGTVKVTAQAVVNRSIDRSELSIHQDEFSEEDWKAIKFVPQVNKVAFEKLSKDSPVLNCVNVKPGKFQLRIVEDIAD